MTTIFANGTIAAGTTLSASSGLDQFGAGSGSTVTNNGTVLFAETGALAPTDTFYGNLVNNGVISATVAKATTGETVTMGSAGNTLTNAGTLSITDSNATCGATDTVLYGSISNSGTFSTMLSGASTVSWGYANVSNSGSVLISSTASTGASVYLGTGLAGTLTLNNSGTFTVNEGGASSGSTFCSDYAVLNNSGTYVFTASSGTTGATSHFLGTVNNTGTMTLSSNKTSRSVVELNSGFDGTLNNAGTVDISNFDVYADHLSGTGTINIGAVGDLILEGGSGTASGQTIDFSTISNSGTVMLLDSSFAGKIHGFGTGDHIDVSSYGVLSYNASTGVLTDTSLLSSYSLNIGLGYSVAKFSISLFTLDDGVGVFEITYSGAAPCFLPGTLIATPDGERPVEQIAAGDQVMTLVDGALVPATVCWTGSRTLRVRPGIDPIDAYPVRIRRDAFAPGLPTKDLLVTSEHCLFVDGRLVPARMLVNGGSIQVDTAITRYSFHHLELEQHAILLSDGMPSESYLDTGNRSRFSEHASPALHPAFGLDQAHKSWDDAAAPLATDPATVRPIWDRLAARSAAIGHVLPPRPATLSEADPHLLTGTGERIDPVLADSGLLAFVVPAGAGRLRLASRAARPSDSVGPFLDDRRVLGVKIGRIGVASGPARQALDLGALDAGWHVPEHDGRWTDGMAMLPIDANGEAPLYLDIEIIATACYLADAPSVSLPSGTEASLQRAA